MMPKDMSQSFVLMVRFCKTHLKMTNKEISAVLGISRPTLQKYVENPGNVSIKTFEHLQTYLYGVRNKISEIFKYGE